MTARKGFEDSHLRYPVVFGDIWRIGRHTVTCGDIERGDAARVLGDVKPDITYTDPPWTPALLTNFRGRAGFAKGMAFDAFIRALANTVSVTKGDIYIEMGNQYVDLLRKTMASIGLPTTGAWPITYYKRKPANLVRFGGQKGTADFTGRDDADTPHLAIAASSEAGESVFDPCAGHGLTAEAAHRLGRDFIGMEINPARAAVTIDLLSRLGAGTASKVGSI